MSYTTSDTDQVEALRHLYGQRWEFWAVYRVVGGTLWCARLHDNHGVVVQGHSAAELVRAVTSRHSVLSYLLNSGHVSIAVVASWAGHADGGATALRHYVRTRPGDLAAARDALAALLGA
jgi:integrase